MLRLAPLFLSLLACTSSSSSGSGVDGMKKLVELNTTERQQVCTYMVQAEGGEHKSKTCGDGLTITVKSASDCASSFSSFKATCTATVDNAESCAEEAGADLCNLVSAPSCSFLFQCI